MKSHSQQFIRSRKAWDVFINGARKPEIIAKHGPKLDAFSNELVLSVGGLAQAEYPTLVGGLSEQDFLELLSLFGIGPELARQCVGKEKCVYDFPHPDNVPKTVVKD